MITLQKLLEATPYPPETTDIGQLLAAAEVMVRARTQILKAAVPGETDPALRAELAARDEAWRTALAAALRVVGDQRIAVRRLRSYGGASSGLPTAYITPHR